jgi:demethylmenaquinone methyltransferase / 2-methoxy-6-polyprenyl-1,4-benzoquinol methylase
LEHALGSDPTARVSSSFVKSLFNGLPTRYDALANLLSFGQDRRWRAAVVEKIASSHPKRVLDVACGPAGITLAMARACDAEFVGVDLTEPMLRRGLHNIREAGLDHRIHVALGRGEQLPFRDATFDAISFSYLLRYVDDPAATIAELGRCLAPGGTMASLEFHTPPWAPARITWWLYTRLILPVAGAATGGREWYKVGRFLGPSITYHYVRHPVSEHVASWQAAGLRGVGVRLMSFGGGLVMWGTKAAATQTADALA